MGSGWVRGGCRCDYGAMNGHSRLRDAWRERPVLLVKGTRLDLFPRGRGGAVEGSCGIIKSSAPAGGPRAAAVLGCGGCGAVMARAVRRVLSWVLAP